MRWLPRCEARGVASAHDPLEQQADRLAASLTATSLDASSAQPDAAELSSSPARNSPGPVPEALRSIASEAVRSTGQQLDDSTRQFFEPRLGMDLGHVRVHADSAAASSAKALHATAYTVASEIVFGAGRYEPATSQGRSLLAHELAHVKQQSAGLTSRVQLQGDPAPLATPNQDDQVVEDLIFDAFKRNALDVERAFIDLRDRRCLKENCGDENLAAAEHYMFARYMVEIKGFAPEVMLAAIYSYSLVKYFNLAPSLCPDVCPVTPTSEFQTRWAVQGVKDAMTVAPRPPLYKPPLYR